MPRKLLIFLFYFSLSAMCVAQPGTDTAWKKLYRGAYPRINDLVHTKLNVSFDYDKAQMNGEAWISLKPHFYSTDSLNLDAKQMDIERVSIVKGNTLSNLKYEYDGWHLKIKLGRRYRIAEQYTVYIKYISKPATAKLPADRRGLYFINPKGNQKDTPTQIWTDGETENTSVWCPTLDKPNQKTTEEIIMTVPEKYTTLSNGRLASQKINADGTRTDDWKMDLPHAPYLFFMGAGEFAVTRDGYKGKEVNYYTEKEYASTARRVFGMTPAMMAFFEQITGVPFPWIKYSQIVLRDFTSTAMENTTSTAHAEGAQQDARELVDGNDWEDNIAHELFHQWFGDYVGCESWSNLTLSESFARYGEYLWREHRYGADAAGEEIYTQLINYLREPGDAAKPLVRFYYSDPEDMFDGVSYGKGSLILHMLRNLIGDSAFFKGLNLYLTRYKFQSVNVHNLRIVMEEVCGKDLNWFFNQWYFGVGHPKVTINYKYDDSAHTVRVSMNQTQGADHLFRMPLRVDVYNASSKQSHEVWLVKEKDTFSFHYDTRPDLVNVDANKILLWDKTDNKTVPNFIFQYGHAGNYIDRREAIAACAMHQQDSMALGLLLLSLHDQFAGLREFTMRGLNMKNDITRGAVETQLRDLAKNDKNSYVRAMAIQLLSNYGKKDDRDFFEGALNDSSYSVAAAALMSLAKLDSTEAYRQAKRLAVEKNKWALANVIVVTLLRYGTEDDFDFISAKYADLPFRIRIMRNYAAYLTGIQSTEKLKKGIDIITVFRETLSPTMVTLINREILSGLAAKKDAAGLKEQAEYIRSKLPQN